MQLVQWPRPVVFFKWGIFSNPNMQESTLVGGPMPAAFLGGIGICPGECRWHLSALGLLTGQDG